MFDDRDIESGDGFGRRGIDSNRPSAEYETLLRFAHGTDILTPDGLRPVERLGEGDLVVWPQHRLLVRSKVADRMFQSREVSIPAKKPVSVEGISLVEVGAPVTDFNLLFDRHQVVFANGLPAESLFLVPGTLRKLPEAAQRQVRDLFPERASGAPALPAARRIVIRRRQVEQLLTRHRKHSRPLVI